MSTQETVTQETVTSICPPKWGWLLAGFTIGIFSSFLVYLTMMPVIQEEIPIEGIVSENTTPLVKTTLQSAPALVQTVPKTTKSHILQVGSYQKQKQAAGMQAYLATLKIETTIKTVTLSDTGIWYKVHAGPFSDLAQLQKIRDLLTANKISSLVVQE